MIRYVISQCLLMFSSTYLLADASSFTRDQNQEVLKQLPFDNRDDFEEATKGFIASFPDDGIINYCRRQDLKYE